MAINQTLLERFLRYVKIDTTSNETSGTHPSSKSQFDLANLLVNELKELGLSDAHVDEKCYVMASLASNLPKTDKAYGKVPAIGLIAHLDTSSGAPGANIKPQVIQNYKGGDIALPATPGKVIPEDKHLKECIGHTLVTSDGTTLLGGDDKSGIAAIMTALQTLANNPSILHGDVKVCFTPDEEIGEGSDHFDVKKFGAKYGYTFDGEFLGEINNETFSANGGVITVQGHNTHPGYAKDVMVNAIKTASDIIARLPKHTSPETTEAYEPYLHPMGIEGNEEKATIKWLFRDFKTAGLADLQKTLENIIASVQKDHPKATITLEVKEQYRNMLEKLKETPEVLNNLQEAVEKTGIKPVWNPIRGGTDGARLSTMGLPTPNVFAGFYNYHSTTEWASVQVMEAASKVVLSLLNVWVEKSR